MKQKFLLVTDIHNEKVYINLENISFFYSHGDWIKIQIGSEIVIATDISIEKLKSLIKVI